MNRLDGKVALISGGARGIGGETARLIVEAGARVVIGDVLDERGRDTARTLGKAALYQHLDVTSEEDWEAAIGAAVGRWGKLDILVNNAGLFLGKDLETASLAEWHRLCAVNLTGVFLGTKLAIPALREAGEKSPHGSVIVNLSSVAGLIGDPRLAAYCASKGGVRLLTKSVALHCARRGYGIRCNSVHPSFVETPMLEGMLTRSRDPAKARAGYAAAAPLGRIAQPDDVARMILFLASDESAFTTGAEFVVDGGLTAA